MNRRLERLFILVGLPGLVVAGLFGYALQKKYLVAHGVSTDTFAMGYHTVGFLAAINFLACALVFASVAIARRAVEPINVLVNDVRIIAQGVRDVNPQITGVADIDGALSELRTSASAARNRLNAERTLAADVSHQLRSPLTALSLRLEQIASDTVGTHIHDDALGTLVQVERMVTLVESLLTTWRTTTDRRLERIELSKFVRASAANWTQRYSDAGRSISVICDTDVFVLGTPGIQELVFSVLLENSLKYGAGKTSIRVSDYRTWMLIEVGDEGDGISDDVRGELMTAGSTTQGTGLGLAWARSQVASDGGRLELRSIKPAVFGVFLIASNSEEESESF